MKSKVRRYRAFKLFYFPEIFYNEFSAFHYLMESSYMQLFDRDIRQWLCITFPSSGKSSEAQVYSLYSFLYNNESFITYQSSVQENVNNFCAGILQLINTWIELDFNQGKPLVRLGIENYSQDSTDKKLKFSARKIDLILFNEQGSDFPSRTGRWLACSVEQSLRGVKYLSRGVNTKPNLCFLDDVMSTRTDISHRIHDNVKNYIFETRRSINNENGVIVTLGNVTGSENYLEELISTKSMPYLIVPLTEPISYYDGKTVETIGKEGKFNDVSYTEEAYTFAKLHPRFSAEYQCQFTSKDDCVFSPTLTASADKPIKKHKSIGGVDFYYTERKSKEKYYIGVDTSEGKKDPHALVIMKETNDCIEIVGIAEALIQPIEWARFCCSIVRLYKDCTICVENESTGSLIINELKEDEKIFNSQIYKRAYIDKVKQKKMLDYGVKMSAKYKQECIFRLQGVMLMNMINPFESLHEQLETYTYDHLYNNSKKVTGNHHFDLLFSCAHALTSIKVSATSGNFNVPTDNVEQQ